MHSEEELALALQRGDTSALTRLVEKHHSPLIGFLYRMTGGDRTLAEDLAQEAFLRVIRAIHLYHYPRPFKPWLYAIAANIARDHYKSAEMRHTIAMPDDSHILFTDSAAPEDALLDADEEQHVAAAIIALPSHQRETLILRYYQGLSLAEIAEALNLPIGTVKSRLSLGLRGLKIRLERELS